MINNSITSWFLGTCVMEDAAFDTRNLYRPGKSETRGQCIHSKTYPSKGTAIECLSDEDSMTGVACLAALSGCGMRVWRRSLQ